METPTDESFLEKLEIDETITVANIYAKISCCIKPEDGPIAVVPIELLFHRYFKLHSDLGGISFEQFWEDLEILKANGSIQFIYEDVDPDSDSTSIAVIFHKKEVTEH